MQIKERIFLHRMLGISVGALAVFLLGFAIVPVLIASASATNQVAGSIDWGVVTLTLDPDYGNGSIGDEGHGDVLFNDITPSSNNVASGGSNYGTLKILKKTVGITSASGKYYTVFLSMEGENNNLNLQLPGSEVDSQVNIPAISTNSASFANPQTFSGSGWGFAVPGTTISVNNVTPSYVTPAATVLGEQITANTSDTDIAGASTAYAAVWSPVPVASAAQQIWKASTNNQYGFGTWKENEGTPEEVTIPGDTVNNHFDIYYAIAADTDQLAGTYANKVVYTALASASQLDQVSTNMIRDVAFGGEGDVQTLKFDLVESLPFLEESDIKIVVVPHSTIAAADYDVSGLSQSNFAECPVVANSLDSTSGTYTSVQCTMPSIASIQAKSGSSSSDVEDGTGIGSFDYWLNVSGYNYNYLSLAKDANSNNVASFVYAGLQSKYYDAYSAADALATNYARNGEYVVQDMQQMRGVICDQTNRWNKKWGNMAKLYRYDAIDTDFAWEADALNIDSDEDGTADTWDPTYHTGKSDKLIYDTTNTLADASYGIQEGIGSFILKDTRDGKRYVVRRLGDGGCWMAQNLDLDLYTGMTLTKADTDIGYDTAIGVGKDVWIIKDGNGAGIDSTTNDKDINVGSLSVAWQKTHGIESVKLYRGVWNGTSWDETLVAKCENGTNETPCYAETQNSTSSDINTITYSVRKTTLNSSLTHSFVYTDADGNSNGSTPVSCSYKISTDGVLQVTQDSTTEGYCRIETTGPTLITQKLGQTGYGIAVPEATSATVALAYTALPTDDAYGTVTGVENGILINTMSADPGRSIASSAGDFRWLETVADGAHAYDMDNRLITTSFTPPGGTATTDSSTVPYATERIKVDASSRTTNCQTIGYTSGTLKNEENEPYIFLTCGTDKGTNGNEEGYVTPTADSRQVGNLYNWYAATAGSGTHERVNGRRAADSICPSGWKLPDNRTGAEKGTFPAISHAYSLSVDYGGSSSNNGVPIMNIPFSYSSSMGRYAYETAVYNAYTTYHWSSYTRGNYSAEPQSYYRNYYHNGYSPIKRGTGAYVRCAARD